MKTWYLYLLECIDGSIYTGITIAEYPMTPSRLHKLIAAARA